GGWREIASDSSRVEKRSSRALLRRRISGLTNDVASSSLVPRMRVFSLSSRLSGKPVSSSKSSEAYTSSLAARVVVGVVVEGGPERARGGSQMCARGGEHSQLRVERRAVWWALAV